MLCKIACESEPASEDIVFALLRSEQQQVIETAKKLLRRQQQDSATRRALQGYLLRHDRNLVIDGLIESIDESYAFRAILSLDQKDVFNRLREKMPKMENDSRQRAQLLKVLLGENPTKALVDELKKEDGISRNLVLYWLAKKTNADAAVEIAELLTSAPRDFFNEGEYTNTYALQHAIEACHVDKSSSSIEALISLLDAKLDRFKVDRKDEEWNRYIAAHLIELTDVSFGVDKAKWQLWYRKSLQK